MNRNLFVFLHPFPTIHSNLKLNKASWMNDCELVTSTRLNVMPTQQATQQQKSQQKLNWKKKIANTRWKKMHLLSQSAYISSSPFFSILPSGNKSLGVEPLVSEGTVAWSQNSSNLSSAYCLAGGKSSHHVWAFQRDILAICPRLLWQTPLGKHCT